MKVIKNEIERKCTKVKQLSKRIITKNMVVIEIEQIIDNEFMRSIRLQSVSQYQKNKNSRKGFVIDRGTREANKIK